MSQISDNFKSKYRFNDPDNDFEEPFKHMDGINLRINRLTTTCEAILEKVDYMSQQL